MNPASSPKPAGPPKATSGAPLLQNSPLNLAAVRDNGRKELVAVLTGIAGRKTLVLDPRFSGPLSLVAEAPFLREHGVDKIHYLLPGEAKHGCVVWREGRRLLTRRLVQHGVDKIHYLMPERRVRCVA